MVIYILLTKIIKRLKAKGERRKFFFDTYHWHRTLNFTLSTLHFIWAFRFASGFPLYLCSPSFPSRSQIPSPFPNPILVPKSRPRSQIPFPNPIPKTRSQIPSPICSQRMPLQSLTQRAPKTKKIILQQTLWFLIHVSRCLQSNCQRL